jgi:hypothetical protein
LPLVHGHLTILDGFTALSVAARATRALSGDHSPSQPPGAPPHQQQHDYSSEDGEHQILDLTVSLTGDGPLTFGPNVILKYLIEINAIAVV